jgi:hypothetical protein
MYAYIDMNAFKASGYSSVKDFLREHGTSKMLGQLPKKDAGSYVELQPGWSVIYRLKM